MRPSIPVEYILRGLCYFFPSRKWLPGSSKDFVNKCSPNLEYAECKKKDKISYKDNHRLATAYSCIEACDHIQLNYKNFITPVIIFHGDMDVVTDYNSSREFYHHIESSDKTFKSIKNGYHNLFVQTHENDKNPEIIVNNIISWVEERINIDFCSQYYDIPEEESDNFYILLLFLISLVSSFCLIFYIY